jgi:hypothetical protein
MQPSFKLALIASAAALMLAACGGGGDSGGSSAAPAGNTPVALKLTGTVATGQAIANATVQAKCASGTGSATSAADGSFTLEVTSGALPCVLEAKPASGTTLHAAIDGSGAGSTTVNITPLTELVAGRVAGGAAADLFTNFDASARAKVTPAAVDAAIAAITASLKGNVDIAGMNPMRDALVAANGTRAGNAHDQKLDALKAALAAARITLPEIGAALAADALSTAHVATLLNPASASCSGLRSGRYQVLSPSEVGHDAARVAHRITVDATGLTFVDEADTSPTPRALTPDATASCRFTLPGTYGTTTLLVAGSGMGVALAPSSTGSMRASIVVPEQNVPIEELAGTWNLIGFGHGALADPLLPIGATMSIDASGKVTASAECSGVAACNALAGPFQTFAASTTGGFDLRNAKAVAFKSASGKVSTITIDKATGSIVVAVKAAPLALPAVGDVAKVWDFTVAGTGVASTPTDLVTTVTAVDTAAKSYTRERQSDGRLDSMKLDMPRPGLRYRAAGNVPIRSGATVSASELIMLPVPDTGIWVYTSTFNGAYSLGVSVAHP